MRKYFRSLEIFLSCLILVLGCLATFYSVRRVYLGESENAHESTQSIVHSRLVLFQQALDKRIAVGTDLKTLIFSREGRLRDIDNTIQEIYRYQSPMITDIVLAPAGRVAYTYPVDSDKAALLDTNIFQDDRTKDLAVFCRDSQRTMITVSENQKDGKSEVFICTPVYLREEDTGYTNFWGFVMIFCPYQPILTDARIPELASEGYEYSLVMHSTYGNTTHTLTESSSTWSDDHAERYTVEEPGYYFILSAEPEAGWYNQRILIAMSVVLLVVTVLLATLVVMLFRLSRSNQLLAQLSEKDDLTGLPNRRSFRANVEMRLNKNKPVTIFFMDANHFKTVNDTLGHDAGNLVLKEYAARLAEVFDGKAYRLGGDEFAGYMNKAMTQEEIQALTDKIHEALAAPFVCHGREVTLSMAVGSAIPDNGQTYAELMQQADHLMYENKKQCHAREETEAAPAVGLR